MTEVNLETLQLPMRATGGNLVNHLLRWRRIITLSIEKAEKDLICDAFFLLYADSLCPEMTHALRTTW